MSAVDSLDAQPRSLADLKAAAVDAIVVTVVTSPDKLGKSIGLTADGKSRKLTHGTIHRGTFDVHRLADLADFDKLRASLTQRQALIYGRPAADHAPLATVAAVEAGTAPVGAVARDNKSIAWPASPGILMIDYDPREGATPLTLDELHGAAVAAVPALADVMMLGAHSTGARVVAADTGLPVAPSPGLRLYAVVDDAREIPRVGEALAVRSVLAAPSRAWLMLADSGVMLDRGLLDDCVWQAERLDFVTPGIIGDAEGLRVSGGQGVMLGGPRPRLAAAAVPALADEERSRYRSIFTALRAEPTTIAAASAQRESWSLKCAGGDIARAAELRALIEGGELPDDFTLATRDHGPRTIASLIADASVGNEVACDDPLAPSGDLRVARLSCNRGQTARIHSFAYGGGTVYTVVPTVTSAVAGMTFATPQDRAAELIARHGTGDIAAIYRAVTDDDLRLAVSVELDFTHGVDPDVIAAAREAVEKARLSSELVVAGEPIERAEAEPCTTWREYIVMIRAAADESTIRAVCESIRADRALTAEDRNLIVGPLQKRWKAVTSEALPIRNAKLLLWPQARKANTSDSALRERPSLALILTEGGDDTILASLQREDTEAARPEGHALNVALMLTHSVTEWDVGFDSFLQKFVRCRRGADSVGWAVVDDVAVDGMATSMQQAFGSRAITGNAVRSALHALLSHGAAANRDSLKDWLETLPAWDGTSRVEAFLVDYCGADDEAWSRAVSDYLWTALAARASEVDGCKADIIPILIGDQGLRKSTMVASLAPKAEWAGSIDLDEDDADKARKTHGKCVVEIPEMKGFGTRDEKKLKAWVTAQYDEYVPKYLNDPRRAPRRYLPIGTANPDEVKLSDPTGNRRYAPVVVTRCDTDAIAKDRDQLWTEALVRYRAKGVAWAPVEALQTEAQAEHIEVHPWEAKILDWYDAASQPPPVGFEANILDEEGCFTVDQVAVAVGVPFGRGVSAGADRAASMDLGRLLRRLGFERVRSQRGGRRNWRWRKQPS